MPIDLVNNPPHYKTHGDIECIQAIEAALGPYGFAAYCKGNVIKYIWRSDFKEPGNRRQDLLKAEWYLHRIIERTEGDGE